MLAMLGLLTKLNFHDSKCVFIHQAPQEPLYGSGNDLQLSCGSSRWCPEGKTIA